MITTLGKIELEVGESKDKKDRYYLKKVWDNSKKIATVITLYPSTNKMYEEDLTIHLISR